MNSEIKFIAFIDDKKWPYFLWHVIINDEMFEYKTGSGHCTEKHDIRGRSTKKPDGKVISMPNKWVHVPEIDQVLHALFLDAEFSSESFDDFCDNSGYSNDSLKALDIYRACAENGKKLKRALGKEYTTEKERIEKLEL